MVVDVLVTAALVGGGVVAGAATAVAWRVVTEPSVVQAEKTGLVAMAGAKAARTAVGGAKAVAEVAE